MQEIVYQIKRGDIPVVDEAYFEECCSCIISTIQSIFVEERGNYSFDSIYHKTRELCIYKQQERLFDLVSKCLQEKIESQMAKLKQQLLIENCDVILVADQFWTFTYRCIQTVSSLLMFLSKTGENWDINTFALGYLQKLFVEQENEMSVISKIYHAILFQIQQTREHLLQSVKEKSDMEIESNGLDLLQAKRIVTIVEMIDLLGFYPQLESQHYSAIQAFYRTYAYELLVHNPITVFLDCIHNILAAERLIGSELLRSHHLDRVENEVLTVCISLFASEIMTKGLSQLIQASQFEYLHTMYKYYSKIGKLEDLKTEVTAVIAKQESEIVNQMSIPAIVSMIKSYNRMISDCFEDNTAYSLAIKSSFSAVFNKNIEKCSEKLVQWIHMCVCQKQEKDVSSDEIVPNVLLILKYTNQFEPFETLYRRMLYSHLLAYKDQLLPEENAIIDELKNICGNVFISRLDSLAKDAIFSREFAEYLRQWGGDSLFKQSCFHLVSKDAAYKQNDANILPPPQILELQKQFESAYFAKYNSRVIQFLYNESHYTVEYRQTDLVVTFPQLLILECFQNVNQLSLGDLQTLTNLSSIALKTAVKELAAATILRVPSELDNASLILLNDSPSLPTGSFNLVPPVSLTIHTPTAAVPQDMSAVHHTRIDAAVVRILKKKTFIEYSALAGELSSLLDFVPDDSVLKERVDLLISKDYIIRDEKDDSILRYQALCVCFKQTIIQDLRVLHACFQRRIHGVCGRQAMDEN